VIEPRIWCAPAAVSTLGLEAIDLYEQATGQLLDDEQRFVLEHGMGLRDDGKWAAFEVAVNEPRQNGKNEILIARQLAGLFLLKTELLIHSAHEFKTSTEHQRRIERIVQDNPDLHRRVKPRGYRHSHGQEAIELRTGQRLRFFTRTKTGGLGHTGDELYFDEAMELAAAMIGALMPTLSARSVLGNPQVYYSFTAVDQLIREHGVVATRLRDRGRRGDDPALAYFEWSSHVPELEGREALAGDVTREQALDERFWEQANPAIDRRISREHIANELRSMPLRQFVTERMGIPDPPATSDDAGSAISLEAWRALADDRSKLEHPVAYGFGVRPDRTAAAVAAAGWLPNGEIHVEIGEHQGGTGWIVERLTDLAKRRRPVAVVANGGREPLVAELERAGVKVTPLSAGDYVQACAGIVDLVDQGKIHHLGDPALDSAVRTAKKRPLGEAWAFARSGLTDISPLEAVALAVWGLREARRAPTGPMVAFA